jgi:hypothetical protein
MITGESLRARKSLMRMSIDRSIAYPWTSHRHPVDLA